MSRAALYEPSGWALLRAPLLDIGHYTALAGSAQARDRLVDDPRVRAALLVASDDITAALGRTTANGRDARRLRAGLLRYLIRMSTRPTPYGLFAGVGLVQFGAQTDATVTAEAWRSRSRLDMAWLLELVLALESRPEVRRQLRLFANPGAYELSGRIHLATTEPTATGQPGAVSVRATAPVRAVLAAARQPAGHQRLLDAVLAVPGSVPGKAHRLLDQLWEQTIVLTDLRPPATTADPLGYVLDRLRSVPAAQPEARGLAVVARALREWDELALTAKAQGYASVTAAAHRLRTDPTPAATGIQVDLALPLRGGIHAAVAKQAVIAAETLLRLTSRPAGSPRLQAYRRAFVDKYAEGEVPLLELLDERVGLGPVSRFPHQAGGWQPSPARQRTLRTLALEAIRDARTTVLLDDTTLRSLQSWDGPAPDAPFSLDISLFVLATSPAALDRGDFEVMVGPNVGASAAGRNTGRFADLLGPPAREALAEVARRESALRPDAVWAETSYLPARFRSMNVTIRPLVRDHEIALGTGGAAGRERLVHPADLLVGLRDGRFTLRCRRTGREVIPRAGHMLNAAAAPPLCQFLDELGHDGRPDIGGFDWGPAALFPFLPRVQYGRVVLAPAQWRVEPDSWSGVDGGRTEDAMESWRKRWNVPRHVYVSLADNRLLLDLDDLEQAQLLHAELRTRAVVLQEALPGPEHAWLPGPDGPRVAELVVPLVRRAREEAPTRTPAPPPRVVAADRVRPLGSDWLYLKLYGARDRQDALLGGHVLPFTQFACRAGLARRWFFIRYADPRPHLRLRLCGDPATVLHRLLPEVVDWANNLVGAGDADRWCLDNYEREVERYGGPPGVELAERIAAVDSVAVAGLLALDPLPTDRIELATVTIDDLLRALGLGVEARRGWCGEATGARQASGQEYRRRKGGLRRLLSGRYEHLGSLPGGAAAAGILAERHAALSGLGGSVAGGRLTRPTEELLRSYVHLHCNRLLPQDGSESLAIGLLKRTLDTLAAVRE
jgi:class I lanthipeptide synthase